MGGRQVEDNKGMKRDEREMKRTEEKKIIQFKWKQDHEASAVVPFC